MGTYGPAFSEALDGKRIRTQMERVREFMLDQGWLTLAEIEEALRIPQASISAQLRHLRKMTFGAFRVDKSRRGSMFGGYGGTWAYRVRPPKEPTQERLF